MDHTHTLEHRDHDSVFWSKTTQWSIAITILSLLEQSNTLEYLDEEPSGESENKNQFQVNGTSKRTLKN